MNSDCREEEGITIGLIDSIITIARIISERNLEGHNIREALEDLRSDEDVLFLLNKEV